MSPCMWQFKPEYIATLQGPEHISANLAALFLELLQALSIQAMQIGGVHAPVACSHQLCTHVIHGLGRCAHSLLNLIVPAGPPFSQQ